MIATELAVAAPAEFVQPRGEGRDAAIDVQDERALGHRGLGSERRLFELDLCRRPPRELALGALQDREDLVGIVRIDRPVRVPGGGEGVIALRRLALVLPPEPALLDDLLEEPARLAPVSGLLLLGRKVGSIGGDGDEIALEQFRNAGVGEGERTARLTVVSGAPERIAIHHPQEEGLSLAI